MTTARLLAMGHLTELTMSHVPDIIKLMETKRDKTIVQRNGCGALQNLASNDDNKKTIAKMGGIKVILDAMKRHESNADVQPLSYTNHPLPTIYSV